MERQYKLDKLLFRTSLKLENNNIYIKGENPDGLCENRRSGALLKVHKTVGCKLKKTTERAYTHTHTQ